MIKHRSNGCLREVNDRYLPSEDNAQYGVWLRTSAVKPGMINKQKKRDSRSSPHSQQAVQQIEDDDVDRPQSSFGRNLDSAKNKASNQETPITLADFQEFDLHYEGGDQLKGQQLNKETNNDLQEQIKETTESMMEKENEVIDAYMETEMNAISNVQAIETTQNLEDPIAAILNTSVSQPTKWKRRVRNKKHMDIINVFNGEKGSKRRQAGFLNENISDEVHESPRSKKRKKD